jgi:hypothetical protein
VPATIAGDADEPAALLAAFADKGPLIFAFFLCRAPAGDPDVVPVHPPGDAPESAPAGERGPVRLRARAPLYTALR